MSLPSGSQIQVLSLTPYTLRATLYTLHHNNNREALTSRLLFPHLSPIAPSARPIALAFHLFFHQTHHTDAGEQSVKDQTLV